MFETLWGFMGASEPYSVATGWRPASCVAPPTSTLDGVWRATSFTVDGREAVAISDRNKVPKFRIVRFASQVSAGYTTRWLLKVDGDRLELRERKSDPAQVVARATQPNTDLLVLTGELDGRQIKGSFERPLMGRT